MEEPMDPASQKIVALAAMLGSLIGGLKALDVLSEDAAEQLFRMADEVLPDSASAHGPEVLGFLRSMASKVTGSPTED